MRKRALSVILAVTMLFVMVFAPGNAVRAEEPTPVAEVNGTQYTAIDEAVVAWQSNCTPINTKF